MGLEFGFPYGSSRFFAFSFGGKSQLSSGGSSTISELLKGLRLTCSVLKTLKSTQWSDKGPYEPSNGSCRLKIRDIEGFRGGFCRLRTRGSSIISTRIGQGRGNVIARTRGFRLRGLGDRKGAGKGFECEASTTEGDGLSIDVSPGTGHASSGRCGAGAGGGGKSDRVSRVSAVLGAAGDGLGLISRQSSVKVIVKHIKAANGVVKGMKAATGVLEGLKTTPEDVLFLVGSENGIVVILKAAKFVVKSFKVSKGVVTAYKACGEKFGGRWGAFGAAGTGGPLVERVKRLSDMVKTMKAPAAAVKIVRISMGVGKDLAECGVSELLNWSTLRKGYQFSKSALTVFEVVTNLKGGMITMAATGLMGAKGAVEGVGVMMKALWLWREAYVIMLKGFAMSKGACEAFLAISEKREAAQSPAYSQEISFDQSEATDTRAPQLSFHGSSRAYRGLPLRLVRSEDNRGYSFAGDTMVALHLFNPVNVDSFSSPVSSMGECPYTYSGDRKSFRSLFLLAFPV